MIKIKNWCWWFSLTENRQIYQYNIMFNGKNSCWFPTNEYVTVNKQRMELDWNRDFFPPSLEMTQRLVLNVYKMMIFQKYTLFNNAKGK